MSSSGSARSRPRVAALRAARTWSVSSSIRSSISRMFVMRRMLQPQLEEARAGDRIEAIRLHVDESKRLVEPHRRLHRGERVEAHDAVAALPRRGDHALRERTTDVVTAELRAD